MTRDPVDALVDDVRALRNELQAQGVHNARIAERVNALEKDVTTMATGAEARFVLSSEFAPFKRVLTAMLLVVLTALVMAVMSVILGQSGGLAP